MLPGTWSIKIDTQVVAKEAVALLLRLLDGERNLEPRIYKPIAIDESQSPL
jgi:DNA-binding LacI/PurR family transcriptional regulator